MRLQCIMGQWLYSLCRWWFCLVKKFRGHNSFSWIHWYPCFGYLVTSALVFKARVDHFLHTFLPMWSSDLTPAGFMEVSMAAESFWSTYLQACPQALVEVWAESRVQDHLCSEYSAGNYLVTPAEEEEKKNRIVQNKKISHSITWTACKELLTCPFQFWSTFGKIYPREHEWHLEASSPIVYHR